MSSKQQLEITIAALESQRSMLGDAVVDTAVELLKAQLAGFSASVPLPPEPTQTLKQHDYCRKRGLKLETTTFEDLGVSAWKGKNFAKGALGAFRDTDGSNVQMLPVWLNGAFTLLHTRV